MNFTHWRSQYQQDVTITSDWSKLILASELRMLLSRWSPMPRQCYQNAARICSQLPQVEYVLGRATSMQFGTVDHAWNVIGDQHFDLTFGTQGVVEQWHYQAIATIDHQTLQKMTWQGMPPTVYEVFHRLNSDIKRP